MMTQQRQREVEDLARSMLAESGDISPFALAERAKISWFIARDVLRALARRGHATALPTGTSLDRTPPSKPPLAQPCARARNRSDRRRIRGRAIVLARYYIEQP